MRKIINFFTRKKRRDNSVASMTVHQFAESLGNAIDAKDHYTCSHSEEVAVVSQALGVQLGLPERDCELLHIAGHLHDIGKIGLPDSILKKEGRLTDEEYEAVKQHPTIGADIVKPVASVSGLDHITGIILHHHERYDGGGYPHGLKGEQIPFGALIIAVADTLSAMASNRPYRQAIEFGQIVEEIKSCSGSQFDPVVVDAFLEITDSIEQYFTQGSPVIEDHFETCGAAITGQAVLVHQ
ncbi:HD-GYP domain-containing protein [Desulfovibrio sp. JC022]|uniref:HD-GYP domain-containing protein n=1 Tax=Desulfovibrio sp. JC022 TaxID=2593642 RepID=UPI0013D4AB62|nr:HD-GYP domain-containing protein [Desulfovibrio sp. JC022]NDV24675.1 HD-GYP domain-containing protein [Desulfovibrio sp. JC022]